MKRFLSILLVIVMILAVPGLVCACKSEETTKKKKKKSSKKSKITTEEVIDTEDSEVTGTTDEPSDHSSVPTDTTDPTDATLQKNIIPTTSYDCPIQTIGPHEIPEYVYQDVNIDETELFNQDGLKIYINGFNLDGGTMRSFSMRVVNETGHPVKLNLEKLVIDGFSELALWMKEFEAGVTEDFELGYFATNGGYIGIWNPGKIDMAFQVEYADTQATYKTGILTAYTSIYDANKTYDLSYAVPVYEQDGIKISVLDFLPSDRGDSYFLLLIENKSEHSIIVNDDETIVNGIEVSVSLFQMLDPGDTSVASIMIWKDKLTEANIKKIETIGMRISIQLDGDYSNAIHCDPFMISVN